MELYGGELSPYVRKVKMALYEKGLAFDFLNVDAPGHIEAMWKLSPRGEMPVLVDGEVVVSDSTIALEYLEEQYPEPALLPGDPAERVRARALEDLGDRLVEALIFALTRVRMWGETEWTDTIVPAAERELQDLYAYLDAQLGDQEYLCGVFSWADLGLIAHLSTAQFYRVGPHTTFPRVAAWLRRCLARPGVQRNITEVTQAAAHGIRITELPADHRFAGHNFRAERAEFFLRNGMADYLRDGIATRRIRVGVALTSA